MFEFALLCYRCDCEWQTVPVFNNPARKTVSSSVGFVIGDSNEVVIDVVIFTPETDGV